MVAGGAIALITAMYTAAPAVLRRDTLPSVYLLAVLVAGFRWGAGPTTCAAIVAALALDWFFLDPAGTLAIYHPADGITLVSSLAIWLAAGHLAAGARRRVGAAEQREREARVLHVAGRLLGTPEQLDQNVAALAEYLCAELGTQACRVTAPDVTPTETDLDTSNATDPIGASLVPLRIGDRHLGTLCLALPPRTRRWTRDEARLIEAIADQVALAMERDRVRRELSELEMLRRTEAVRQAVLAAGAADLQSAARLRVVFARLRATLRRAGQTDANARRHETTLQSAGERKKPPVGAEYGRLEK
ncbi:MAG: DUF4118 domain-containing protein [Chloroflexi bacterium]|nr:DUF4118 domain-containing protein [Chloroflexota bacterium]